MRKKVMLAVLGLTIFTSLITGTFAVYTKSFPFTGTITKVSKEVPPPPEDDEAIINTPGSGSGSSNVTVDSGQVSIKKRGDYLKLYTLPADEYKVDVDVKGFKDLNAFGVYVDGYYDEEEDKLYADVLQFVSGHLEMKRRCFTRSYDSDNNIIVTEGDESVFSEVATKEDVSSVISPTEWATGVHVQVRITTKTDKNGNHVKVPEVYLNDKLVPNQKYKERSILRSGNKAYIGYRSWYGGNPDTIFSNLKVTPLHEVNTPDVIIPDVGAGGNPNINVDSDKVTIKDNGDYIFKADGITDSSYVISLKIQVDVNAPGNLQDHLKGFGIYLDGTNKGDSILTDRLYFTNDGSNNELRLTSVELIPKIENDKMFYNQSSLEDHAKVTTQGEMGLEWNDAKNGFYLICAVKLDPIANGKQVRVFTADKNMNKMNEVSQYYDTPWTGKPPLRPVYKNSNTIYAGYHANNTDGRSVNFSEFKVSNGLSSIPADLLNKYGW